MNESIKVIQNQRFAPIGECIYCGDTQDLTDEHIIPLALGGTLILPDSSCKKCAAMTSAIELKVLRGFMYDARVIGNFPSRRKKLWPKTWRMRLLTRGHDVVEHDLPLQEASALLMLPTLTRASILNNQPPTHGVNIVGIETIRFGKNIETLLRDRDVSGMEVTAQIQATEFAQLLAKIAYSYHVATQGLFPRDQTPLLRLIRSESDDGGSWVGSNNYSLQIEAQGHTHALGSYFFRTTEQDQNVVIQVKLFSNTGATGYEVATRIPGWMQYIAT
jgi:hypothetical protein